MEKQQKKENSFLNKDPRNKEGVGTTNEHIESHKKKEETGYKIAIEDTMIGYDGHEDQMDIDLGNDRVNTNNTRGVDDNG